MPTSTTEQKIVATAEVKLSSKMERFDSFWEGPVNIERGYKSVGQFYKVNYLKDLPEDREARLLVISCGPGYFVNVLNQHGYRNVTGIDSHPEKVGHAIRRGLNCRAAKAFEELQATRRPYDVIFCEQELNHLTKDEIVAFLKLAWEKLTPGGRLICHGLNGANPVVGAENLALNFDHFNTFTEFSFEQVLDYCGFRDLKIFGLNLYVFYKNPFNYVAWGASSFLSLIFRALFILYGKSNKIFTKKIAAVAFKPL